MSSSQVSTPWATVTSWECLVVWVFASRGQEPVRLTELFATFALAPDFAERTKRNPSWRTRVRQVCRMLRSQGVLEHVGPGQWRLRREYQLER
jgi:hypothetical protein